MAIVCLDSMVTCWESCSLSLMRSKEGYDLGEQMLDLGKWGADQGGDYEEDSNPKMLHYWTEPPTVGMRTSALRP